jgi:hypothetical protein
VSGTISVNPGDCLTIGVGAGAGQPYNTGCTAGRDETSPADPYDAAADINPLSHYDGGMGGAPTGDAGARRMRDAGETLCQAG